MSETPDPFERIVELEALYAEATSAKGQFLMRAQKAERRIAQLTDELSNVMTIAMDRANADQARIADLEAQVSQLEARDQLDRNAQLDQAQDRIAELENRLAEVTAERNRIRTVAKTAQDQRDQAAAAYIELRHAHAELEDTAGRQAARIRNLETQVNNLRYLNS